MNLERGLAGWRAGARKVVWSVDALGCVHLPRCAAVRAPERELPPLAVAAAVWRLAAPAAGPGGREAGGVHGQAAPGAVAVAVPRRSGGHSPPRQPSDPADVLLGLAAERWCGARANAEAASSGPGAHSHAALSAPRTLPVRGQRLQLTAFFLAAGL